MKSYATQSQGQASSRTFSLNHSSTCIWVSVWSDVLTPRSLSPTDKTPRIPNQKSQTRDACTLSRFSPFSQAGFTYCKEMWLNEQMHFTRKMGRYVNQDMSVTSLLWYHHDSSLNTCYESSGSHEEGKIADGPAVPEDQFENRCLKRCISVPVQVISLSDKIQESFRISRGAESGVL